MNEPNGQQRQGAEVQADVGTARSKSEARRRLIRAAASGAPLMATITPKLAAAANASVLNRVTTASNNLATPVMATCGSRWITLREIGRAHV